MRLLEALRNAALRVQTHVNDSKLFTHMGDRGTFRERILSDFLRPFLAPCFGLASGEVFDRAGNGSKQVDVIVFDALFSAPLLLDQKTNLGVFPCESIYACVEVKSNLTSDELQIAVDNIASVKCLQRQSSDAAQILPHVRLQLGAGLGAGPGVTNPYLGVVFGYKGVTSDTAMKTLTSQSIDQQHLPDFVVCCDPGYLIIRLKDDGRPAGPGKPWKGYGVIAVGDDALPIFFLTLNTCLSSLRLREPDWNQYWVELTTPLIQKSNR